MEEIRKAQVSKYDGSGVGLRRPCRVRDMNGEIIETGSPTTLSHLPEEVCHDVLRCSCFCNWLLLLSTNTLAGGLLMQIQENRLGLFCPNCDYDLTGLTENRCPECGQPFDPDYLERILPIGALRAPKCSTLWQWDTTKIAVSAVSRHDRHAYVRRAHLPCACLLHARRASLKA